MISGKFHKDIYFIFITASGNCNQTVNEFMAECSQASLGIMNFYACRKLINESCHSIAELTPERNIFIKFSASEDQAFRMLFCFLNHMDNIIDFMLTVCIGSYCKIRRFKMISDIVHACFESFPLAFIFSMCNDMSR